MTLEPTSGSPSPSLPHRRAPQLVRAALVDLEHEPVDESSIVDGSPEVGHLGFDPFESGGFAARVGVWEISEGTVTDVEADELFVVLSGSATITVDGGEPVTVASGDVVRLVAGMRTTWQVHELLRKVYVLPSSQE